MQMSYPKNQMYLHSKQIQINLILTKNYIVKHATHIRVEENRNVSKNEKLVKMIKKIICAAKLTSTLLFFTRLSITNFPEPGCRLK